MTLAESVRTRRDPCPSSLFRTRSHSRLDSPGVWSKFLRGAARTILAARPLGTASPNFVSLNFASLGLTLFVGCVLWGLPCQGQQWTRFRGPNGAGESEATTIPVRWNDDGYKWRVELPGIGHSSPVVWGNKLFLTSGDPKKATRYILCINAEDGKIIWQKEYAGKPFHVHTLNSFASASAAVDEKHVYTTWGTPEELIVLALDHDGNEAWSVDLGPYISQHGFASSPIVYEDMIILANDQSARPPLTGTSFIVALNRDTGKTVWKTARKTREAGYSVPCVYQPPGGDAELIFNCGVHGISGVDPHTGKVNWEIDVFDQRTVSSPYIINGLVFGSSGSGGGGNYVVAVQPGTKDRAPEVVYKIDRAAPYVPMGVANGSLLFLWSDKGVASCINASTGEQYWQKRVGGNYYGSPVRVGDRIYCISEAGEVVVLAASEKYKLLARNSLGEASRGTPVVVDGVMYLRTISHLAAVTEK